MTRWGIAGTGGIANAFAEALKDVEDADLIAVGSRGMTKAMQFGQRHGAPVRHRSYESLFADPVVDVVYISTPASHHYRHTMAALHAGKHVLVEKPFAVNAAQAGLMAALAQASGLFLMEAMWPRFLPAYAEIGRVLAEGLIGEVRMVEASFGGRAKYDPTQTAFRTDLAGGTLLHGGCYPIQLAHMIFGSPDRVAAVARLAPSGVDTENGIVLGFPKWQLAVLNNAIGTTLDNCARVYGTDGMVVIPANFTNPPWFEVHWPDKEPLHIDCAPTLHRLAYQAIEVQACIERGATESAVMPLVESCAIIGTLDRVREQIGLTFPAEAEAL